MRCLSLASCLLLAWLTACTAVQSAPNDPLDAGEWRTAKSRMYQDLALQCLRAEDHDRARRLLEQAVQFDPADRSSLELLARLAYASGDLDTAATAAQMLLQLAPESVAALCTLGAVAEGRHQPAEAEGLYRRAMTLASNQDRPGIDLHRLLLLQGREAEATELRRQLGERFPTAIATNLDHGAMLAADGRWDDAASAYDRALTTQPEEPSAATGFAMSAVMARRPAAALALANRLPPHARSDNPALAMTLAIAHLQGGNGRAALRELDLAAPAGSTHAPLHVLRGEILAQLGQPEAAQAAFERALLLTPDNPRAHGGLGRVHLQMGRTHAAVRAFEQAVHAAPEAAVHHALLAAALLGSGDAERAARHAAIARRDPQARALVTELERLHPGLGAAPAGGSR